MNLKSWLNLLVMVFVFGTLINLPWLVYFSAAVIIVLSVAQLWLKYALHNIHYRRRWTYRRGFPGETTSVRIEVENRKLLPISWLKAEDTWPKAAAPLETDALAPSHLPNNIELVNLYSLRWFQRISRSFTPRFGKRGVYEVGPVNLTSGDLFGIYETSKTEENLEYVTVFPDLLPVASLHLNTDDPFGDRGARKRLFEDPNRPIGVRPYHPEDGLRRVHWPATARTGELQVRIYQPVTSQVMLACMNVSTRTSIWEGIDHDLLERLISITSTIVYNSVQEGYSVGLISNGRLAHSDQSFNILPGRSKNQLSTLLQALAAVTAYTVSPFEPFLLKSLPKVPMGATIVVVTSVVTPALMETLLMLRRYRAHTTVISLDAAPPPPLPGLRIIHLPYTPPAKV